MKKPAKRLRELFPVTKPYNTGNLKVSKLHTIHFEECGNPRGKPLLFLHGGPGGGIDPVYRRYFDPKKWRIVLHDQRGCGGSWGSTLSLASAIPPGLHIRRYPRWGSPESMLA